MNHRDHFIASLDANPSDQVTRAIFADWLEEHGDGESDLVLAAGLRWMADHGKNPFCFGKSWGWFFMRGPQPNRHIAEVSLAESLWEAGITNNGVTTHEIVNDHDLP